MNPILPKHHFVPDVEARQWADGRMYLYGSYDLNGDAGYCSREYRVFSSDDLHSWVDHGISFTSEHAHTGKLDRLYAPDCVHFDGKYHLAYCQSSASEGIATAESPAGPFRHAYGIPLADGDAIDPAVFVDDDGSVYYYWGQFKLRGAKMLPGMRELDLATLQNELLTEEEHGFHEGASVRKANGIYYIVYTDISRGRATCMSYATSKSPLGPFTKGGVIVDNTGCDAETWNNHGSIADFNGQWYVFYHRSSQGSRYNRRVCMEPITLKADGSIDEVEMTTQGQSGPLDPTLPMEAWRACLLSGKVRTKSIPPSNSKEDWCEFLTKIQNRDWACYKYFDFNRPVSRFSATAGTLGYGGRIEVRSDNPSGPLLAVCDVEHTGGWQHWKTFTAPVTNPPKGVHAVYLVFKGGARICDLLSFQFN